MNKNSNIIIKGVGGQGIVTLVAVTSQAAFLEGYDVKSSELHGLSQREGSIEAHIKFGKKVFSPLVYRGQAGLIIGLEISEGLRAVALAGSQTKFLLNNYNSPFIGTLKPAEILNELNKIPKARLNIIGASEICKKELEKEVVSSMFLLGYAINKKLMPLEKEFVLQALKDIIPQKYLELNIKAFELGYNHD